MVNFGLNSASILGIFLAIAGASLYFLRSIRPELSRDHDIFFAAVGLLCGFILLFQGWRLDPILQFGQFLLTGSAIFFAVESIRLRGVATEQARRNSKIVDDDRPVSSTRVYRAELDRLEPYDRYRDEDRDRDRGRGRNTDTDSDYENRRLRGYQENRSSRNPREENQSSRSSRNRNRASSYGENPRNKNRPPSYRNDVRSYGDSSETRSQYQDEEDWREIPDHWDDEEYYDDNQSRRPSRPNRPSRPDRPDNSRSSSRPNRSKPIMNVGRSYDDDEIPSADYVDYQPLDDNQQDWDNEDTQQSWDDEDNQQDWDNEDTQQGWDEDNSEEDWDDEENRRKPINFDY